MVLLALTAALLLLWPWSALAAPAEEPSLLLAAVKMLAALAICLGLILGGVHLLRRFKLIDRLQGEAVIKVVATRALGPKRYVSVVEVEGRRLVLGVAEGGVTLLERLPAQEDYEEPRHYRSLAAVRGLEEDEEL